MPKPTSSKRGTITPRRPGNIQKPDKAQGRTPTKSPAKPMRPLKRKK